MPPGKRPNSRAREGDYVKCLEPPRLGLVLSVRTNAVGQTQLLIEDAARPCDAEAAPTWQPADDWERVRRAGGKLFDMGEHVAA